MSPPGPDLADRGLALSADGAALLPRPGGRPGKRPWRRAFAFVGPGYLVAVGYMNPGNWATDLAGGSTYGYALL